MKKNIPIQYRRKNDRFNNKSNDKWFEFEEERKISHDDFTTYNEYKENLEYELDDFRKITQTGRYEMEEPKTKEKEDPNSKYGGKKQTQHYYTPL